MSTQPAPRAKTRNGRKTFGPEERARFLELVETGETVQHAAAAVGFVASTVHRYRKKHPEYGILIDAAFDVGSRHRDLTTKFTEDVRERFLELIAEGHKISTAARSLALNAGHVSTYIGSHPEFRAKYLAARAEALDWVEFEVAQAGRGKNTTVNMRAAEYVLNNRRPQRWRTARLVGLVGEGEDGQPGGPVVVESHDKSASTARIGAALLRNGPGFAALAGILTEGLTEPEDSGDGPEA